MTMVAGQGAQAGREQILFILFTDIYRSSHLWEAFSREYPALLAKHNAAVEAAVADAGGWILKGLGDGYIALFTSPLNCAGCAVEVQRAAAQFATFPDGTPLSVRVICHGGALRESGGDYHGPALNRAARMVQACHPGQVLMSAAVRQLLPQGRVGAGVTVTELGVHHLRDLAEPEQLYQLDHADFACHSFPPLATLANRPNNLTVHPNVFVGRQHELAELEAVLTDPDQRLVTIVAPGGYGKSRLAAQLCAELLDRFEHGVFEVLLAPLTSPARIIGATADALKLQLYSGSDIKEQLLDYLRDRQVLLHFDNFEHLLAGAQLVGVILQAAPQAKVIVTSREPLRLRSEQVYHLSPLATQPEQDAPGDFGPAVRLFLERAALVRHNFDPDARELELIRRMCERLGGVPLSIELAAAWVDSFSPAELLTEVESQLELTARMGDIPERHRSVRASLDWSWKLLTDGQRNILARVSVFNGGFFADIAEQVLGTSGLRRALVELVDKSWLMSRETGGRMRFYLRDAASREYALSRLQEQPGAEQMRLAHAKVFSDLMTHWGAQLYSAGQLDALTGLDMERENLYEALDIAIALCRGDLVLPFAKHMSKYLDMLGRNQEAEGWFERMLECSTHCGNLPQRLAALLGQSRVEWGLGRFDDSDRLSREALGLAEQLGDEHSRASALGNLGNVAWSRGQYDQAEKYYRESLAVGRASGERWATAAALDSLGILAGNRGRYEDALLLFRESLELSRELGDRRGISYSLSHLGYTAFYLGKYDVAQRLGEETLAIRRELRDRRGTGYSLAALGEVHASRAEYEQARGLYLEALELFESIADRKGIAHCLLNLGGVALNLSKFEEAVEHLSRSLALEREMGHRNGIADALRALAAAQARLGRIEDAAPLLLEALELATLLQNPSLTAQILVTSGMVLILAGTIGQGVLLLHGADAQVKLLGGAMTSGLLRRMEQGISEARQHLAENLLREIEARAQQMSLEQLVEAATGELRGLRQLQPA